MFLNMHFVLSEYFVCSFQLLILYLFLIDKWEKNIKSA